MATISITIPPTQTARVIDALCAYRGYQDTLEDGTPNPVTKAAYAKGVVIQLVKDVVRAQEVAAARAAAAAVTDPDLT
jgi:hypothetical protein